MDYIHRHPSKKGGMNRSVRNISYIWFRQTWESEGGVTSFTSRRLMNATLQNQRQEAALWRTLQAGVRCDSQPAQRAPSICSTVGRAPLCDQLHLLLFVRIKWDDRPFCAKYCLTLFINYSIQHETLHQGSNYWTRSNERWPSNIDTPPMNQIHAVLFFSRQVFCSDIILSPTLLVSSQAPDYWAPLCASRRQQEGLEGPEVGCCRKPDLLSSFILINLPGWSLDKLALIQETCPH